MIISVDKDFSAIDHLEMAKKRPRKEKEGKPPPTCKAILLCRVVIVDAMTGTASVIGIFDGFNVPAFPGQTLPCTAFLQLTNGIGSYQITVEIHDLRDDRVVGRAQIAEMVFNNRAFKGNLIIPVPALTLQHEGIYDFVVLADGQEIDRQQFRASAAGDSTNASNQPEEPQEG